MQCYFYAVLETSNDKVVAKWWQSVLVNLTFMKFRVLFKIVAWEEIYTDCGVLQTGRT